jgi:hypothetical protein
MKNDDVPIVKLREELVRKLLILDKDSGNLLAYKYLVPVECGANLGSEVLCNLFLQKNQFLRNTNMQLVHNLYAMDDFFSLDLNKHVDIAPENLTIGNIICSFKVRGEPVIHSIQQMVEP